MSGIRVRSLGLVVVVWSVLAVPVVHAGVRVDIESGALVGLSDVEFGESGVGVRSNVNVGGSWAAGAGWSLNDRVELGGQLQGGYPGTDLGDLAEDNLRTFSLTAGPRVYLLPAGRVRPWLVGQMGWYRARAEATLLGIGVEETDDTFGVNAGGGLDVHVGRHVSLGVDVRYHNTLTALGGLDFVTSMFNVGLHFGG